LPRRRGGPFTAVTCSGVTLLSGRLVSLSCCDPSPTSTLPTHSTNIRLGEKKQTAFAILDWRRVRAFYPAPYEATSDGQAIRWTARDPETARLKLTQATQSIVARRGRAPLGTELHQGPDFRAPRHDGLKMATRAGRQRAWVCLALITDAATILLHFPGYSSPRCHDRIRPS